MTTTHKQSETPKDIEEAARAQARSFGYREEEREYKELVETFIAGAEWDREQHKSVPRKYTEMDFESARNAFSEDVYNHNRKNKTPIDMVDLDDAFETGSYWMEKHMLKDAVEGEVRKDGTVGYFAFSNERQFQSLLEQFQDCDKVRIIIVKED